MPFLVLVFFSVSCSINRLAVRTFSDVLASDQGAAGAFAGDNDPELVGAALPFTLKLYDIFLEQDAANPSLYRAAGSAYISYASAFLQTPATMLDPGEFETKVWMLERAKNLYLRGRDLVLRGLYLRHPELEEAIESAASARIETALSGTNITDVPYLYWAAAGWAGAISTDPLDLGLLLSIGHVALLMARAYHMDPEYSYGAIHDFYISFYASLPEGLGRDHEKARFHFERAIEISGGAKAGPYTDLALSVSMPGQNLEEFVQLMEQALRIDAEQVPEFRLINTIRQRQARWYLINLDRFFLIDREDEEFDE